MVDSFVRTLDLTNNKISKSGFLNCNCFNEFIEIVLIYHEYFYSYKTIHINILASCLHLLTSFSCLFILQEIHIILIIS